MKMIAFILTFFSILASPALATSLRLQTADTIFSSDLTKTYGFPSTSDTLAGQTVPNGGTGAATFALNGVLFGNGTSAIGATGAGAQYSILTAGVGGALSFGSINLASSVAVGSSILGVPNGGTGVATITANAIVIGNGTGAVTGLSGTTTGQVATWNGSAWTASAPSSTSPSINGGSASPQTVTATTGVTLTGLAYSNLAWLSAASAITVTKTPSVTACTADGQKLNLIGTSATNTIKFQDQASLAGSGLSLNGPWIAGKDSNLSLHCDITQGLWVEDGRR
jgi:hypothetical protein